MKLPTLPGGDRIRQFPQTAFGGLNHTAGAEDGDLFDMRNLWSGDFPRLSVRPGRVNLGSVTKPNGLFRAGGSRFTVDGTALYIDGASAAAVTDGPKVFAALGERVLLWPDKKVLTPPVAPATAWTVGSLEASVTVSATFTDGTYAGEAAEGNTIKAASSSFDWGTYFRAGDAVTISGSAQAENNQTIIVREVEGDELRFYENSFTDDSTAAGITVARTVPDLDWICVNENRVWGCKGDTIRCSKLGDPYNWNVFDGLSTDSWSWESGTEGDFTGCISFLGYPCFFKERHIFKVYGSRPANFEPQSAPDFGVMEGCGRSLAIANESLYYLSRVGPVVYAGGIPQSIGESIGRKLSGGVGGSDGLKYYLSAQDENGGWLLYVFDAMRQVWHIQDATQGAFFAPGSPGSVECLTAASTTPSETPGGEPVTVPGKLWTTDTGAAGTAEAAVSWWAELGDYYGQNVNSRRSRPSPNKKTISKVLVRLELPAGSAAGILIRYDGGGDWITVQSITAEQSARKQSWYLPVIPRRCDHFRLKLQGTGPCIVHSITTEVYEGSPNRL
jgi:hypothetical protein